MWIPVTMEEVRGIGIPGAGVTGSYEPSNVDVGDQTLILWKSSECAQPLSCFSSPMACIWISDQP